MATEPSDADRPPWRDRATGAYESAEQFLERRSVARMARAVPRTARFVSSARQTGAVHPGISLPDLTLGLAAGVAMDEAMIAAMLSPARFPRLGDYERVGAELAAALELFTEQGWMEAPASYHRAPPPLANRDLVATTGWVQGTGYEHLSWESGFSPRHDEPGRARWESFGPNKRAAANIVRHHDDRRGDRRPWLVCVHGFTMGFPRMDFQGLQTIRLHNELGLNIALPVLPLHGPRKVTRLSGEPFLSFEMMNSIHGFAQAVWDIRRLISWIRGQGATSIGLYGVSLGGYVVSLLACLEEGLHAVIAGIPVTDVPSLFAAHSPMPVRTQANEHGLLTDGTKSAHRVVSPLVLDCLVPGDRRFIFAGYGDRLAFPYQADRLREHWGRPAICWYHGGHVGYLWSREVARFLGESLVRSGLQGEPSANGSLASAGD
jgi:hypothetical protein